MGAAETQISAYMECWYYRQRPNVLYHGSDPWIHVFIQNYSTWIGGV